MKILITADGLNSESGGPARCIISMSAQLHKFKADVSVYAYNKSSKSLAVPNGVNLYAGKLSETIKEQVQQGGLDVIHDNGMWLPLHHAVAAQAQKHNIPLIITPRGMLEPWSLNNKWLKKRIAWMLYQRRDINKAMCLHATSEQEAKNLRALGLRLPIAVIANGVDVPDFSLPKPSEKAVAKPRKTVLFISRIQKKKGLLNLLDAWAALRPKDWTLRIVGPDEDHHREEVIAKARALGINDEISVEQELDDTAKWEVYRQADIFVLPTFSENFGIVIAEALAAGVPVITTKGAPWSDLETHQCGWWIDIGVPPLIQALSAAMKLSDEERHEMGKRGRALVENSYSWAQITQKMLAVYEWMRGSNTKPDCMI